jgi:hypothetical protein
MWLLNENENYLNEYSWETNETFAAAKSEAWNNAILAGSATLNRIQRLVSFAHWSDTYNFELMYKVDPKLSGRWMNIHCRPLFKGQGDRALFGKRANFDCYIFCILGKIPSIWYHVTVGPNPPKNFTFWKKSPPFFFSQIGYFGMIQHWCAVWKCNSVKNWSHLLLIGISLWSWQWKVCQLVSGCLNSRQ